ncbi:MAG: PIG-L family deacetylase [Planctomycetota bacterium]|jgi:LmbE family N-acetylglucosaminyl deacetylase|nr:PIG-L family deacetylase [Planctomycetota bacterium]
MTANTPAQSFPPLQDFSHVPRGPVLIVAPHPDDEICGCGGAAVMHLQRGDPVHVALVTQGEAAGDARERLEESRLAARSLGLTEATCLNSRDGAVAEDDDLPARLAECITSVKPRVIYAPSLFEMHPDHVATLHAVVAALGDRRDVTLLLYEVNAEGMASFLLDITPVKEQKLAALKAFASQLDRIDIVEKVDARNRARTVNVDIHGVTHAEGYMEVLAPDVPRLAAKLSELASLLKANSL